MSTKINDKLKKAKIILAEGFFSTSHFTCDVMEDAFKTAKNNLEAREGLFMLENTGILPNEAVAHRRGMTKMKRRRITKFFDTVKEEIHKIHNLGFGEAQAAYEQEIDN